MVENALSQATELPAVVKMRMARVASCGDIVKHRVQKVMTSVLSIQQG